ADADLSIKPGVSTFTGESLKKMKPPGSYRAITPRVLEQSVKECADLVAEALGLTRQVLIDGAREDCAETQCCGDGRYCAEDAAGGLACGATRGATTRCLVGWVVAV